MNTNAGQVSSDGIKFSNPHVDLAGSRLCFSLTTISITGVEQFREVSIEFDHDDLLFEIRANDHLMAKIDM